jgi:hypothetical protein
VQGKRKSLKVSNHVVERLITAPTVTDDSAPVASANSQSSQQQSNSHNKQQQKNSNNNSNTNLASSSDASGALFGLQHHHFSACDDPVVESYLSDDQIVDTFLRIFMDNSEALARELARAGAEKVATEMARILSALKRESMQFAL